MFLEAQVQNITTNPICMDHVTLDPSMYYEVVPLNTGPPPAVACTDRDGNKNSEQQEIFGSSYMNPMDTRQYLYKLTPNAKHAKELKTKVCCSQSFI